MLNIRSFRRAPLALAAALMFSAGSVALAQGPGMGHHGHGAHGVGVERVVAAVKDRLALDTSQQLMFGSAVAAAKSARESARAERDKMRTVLKAELSKPEPDLAALAAAADASRDNMRNVHRQVREQWLQLYATFSPAQKQVVREVLAQRLERHERFRARMRERFGGQG